MSRGKEEGAAAPRPPVVDPQRIGPAYLVFAAAASLSIAWADVIAVMERPQLARLKRQVGPLLQGKRVVCLDVPDRFAFMDPALVALLTRQFARLG